MSTPSAGPSTREVRVWALANGIAVARTGGLPRFAFDLYLAAHSGGGEAIDPARQPSRGPDGAGAGSPPEERQDR